MIRLSPSSLNLFLDCPRCFWLQFNKGIRRPEGISSSLPSGVDFTLKKYFDHYRKDGLPPLFKGQVEGKLIADQTMINDMRSYNFGLWINEELWFGGMLDDALELKDGSIVPLDNKTRGFPPKETHWAHIMQMSGYTLILQAKKIKTQNLAYLAHWFFDHHNMKMDNPLGFNLAVEEVKTNPQEVKTKILEAVKCLKGDIPSPRGPSGTLDKGCSYCQYRDTKISK